MKNKIQTHVLTYENGELIGFENSSISMNIEDFITDPFQEKSEYLRHVPKENVKEFLEKGETKFTYDPKVTYHITVKKVEYDKDVKNITDEDAWNLVKAVKDEVEQELKITVNNGFRILAGYGLLSTYRSGGKINRPIYGGEDGLSFLEYIGYNIKNAVLKD